MISERGSTNKMLFCNKEEFLGTGKESRDPGVVGLEDKEWHRVEKNDYQSLDSVKM